MQVIKRNEKTVDFDKQRIVKAINKAWVEVYGEAGNNTLANRIANEIAKEERTLTTEEIQNLVENKLMASQQKDVARTYIRYRYKHELIRESNTTDKSIKELLDGDSDYWNNENSNKNAKVVTTQRDYIAGITSTDITRRFLLPKEIVEAHDAGIIHFHK